MWTGKNDLNTVTCGRGSFCNRENIYAVLNLYGYVWTEPKTFMDRTFVAEDFMEWAFGQFTSIFGLYYFESHHVKKCVFTT